MTKKIVIIILPLLIFLFFWEKQVYAQPVLPIPDVNLEIGAGEGPQEVVATLQLLILLTVLSLVPAFVVLMTSFTRVVIVLAFIRNALATQQIPPNQVLVGLALFLTVFIMYPVFQQVNEEAIQPFLEGEIEQEEAMEIGTVPLNSFMLKHTREKDLALFVNISEIEPPEEPDDVPLYVLTPAFVISELKTAFQMGFIIFIPFLIIDMVVASTLMSMGMFMLPPVIVSLPFKLLLFVLVDGWHLVIQSIVKSYF